MSEHLVEMAGALVRIKDGRIEVLTDPTVRCCPLRQDIYGCQEESRETVERSLREHMDVLGMYGPERVLEIQDRPVSFGASEIISDAMAEGLVDAAVVVCEGTGTVVVARPDVLSAIGAHMTGLVRTDPIPEIQRGLTERGCILLDGMGTIDQLQGFREAAKAGFKKIVVTIAGKQAAEAKDLRGEGRRLDIEPTIFAVHTTGVDGEQAARLAEDCDVVWSCASRWIREVVGRRALLQIGVSIPVYALTRRGKALVLNRALNFDGGLVIHRATLPCLRENRQPQPLQ